LFLLSEGPLVLTAHVKAVAMTAELQQKPIEDEDRNQTGGRSHVQHVNSLQRRDATLLERTAP
jgi:hypothetical protein